ncbi:MAG: alpha/beta fold hydrolase [Acidobacteria bacterium]|nr:alpha/beta fold hydrolase [Acidobacteriota bacterium]
MKAQVNGVTLNYDLSGSGRLIAFGHSLGMRADTFNPMRPTLERYGQVLTWDARGHGASHKPAVGWTIEDLAADLRALIQHVGGDRAVIAGLSMGGNTAIAYAVAHPDKVEALILADTTAWYGADAPANWEQRARNAEQKGMPPIVPFNLPRWFSDDYLKSRPDDAKKIGNILAANDVASYAAACRALGRFDARAGLARIQSPTLILVGGDDPATPPAMAEYLHQNIKDSQLHVLPGLRHMTPVEAPDRVGKLIAEFLAELQ